MILIAIYIVDEPCGAGKTFASINFINSLPPNTRVLYVTPFLSEVKRIIAGCPNMKFDDPKKYGTKLNGAKQLIEKGKNVVTTHALFSSFDDFIIELIYNKGYILIMDEVEDVVSEFKITPSDRKVILGNHAHVNEDGRLIWDNIDYDGKFNDYKEYCLTHFVMRYGDSGFLKMHPPSLFTSFIDIYILTYMFDAQFQRMYFDYCKMPYTYIYVKGSSPETYEFTPNESDRNPFKYNYKELIHIFYNDKLNAIGDLDGSLSVSWYNRHKKDSLFDTLGKNCRNFIGYYMRGKSEDVIWTTFKEFKKYTTGKGYAKSYISSNCRSTNEYRDRTIVCYLLNKYMNPYMKQFFVTNGINSDDGQYALSEMLQFLFRSAIRDGKEVNVYMPSKRMRAILEAWLNSFDYSEKKT